VVKIYRTPPIKNPGYANGTGLPVEESSGMTEDRDRPKWRKYVHGVANSRIEDG